MKGQPKEYWDREIASGWKATGGVECEVCGAERSEDLQTFFELVDGGRYYTCHSCFVKELRMKRHLLYIRGCRKALLVDTANESSSREWVILPIEPWLDPVEPPVSG